MSLFDITEFPKSDSYKKTVYFKATVGNRIVRVITRQRSKTWTHYTHQTYVECLGQDECPICKRNVKIRAEFPKDAVKHGLIYTTQRFAVNVYERTPTIVCPECQEENYAGMNSRFSQTCRKCGKILTNLKPEPLNKVKLLTGGVETFRMLEGYAESQIDTEGNPLGLDNFDINLMGMQNGDYVKITPIPMPHQNDKVEIPDEDLFDTHFSVVRLTADEINQLEKGIRVRDILLARKASEPDTNLSGETKKTAEELVNQLFNT